ncbi:alpha-1 2-mannosidase [Streptomyces purpurascens]
MKNATVVQPGRRPQGHDHLPFLGYTSTETHEGLSWALEGYLNDYGISRIGRKLYEETGERRYKEESEYFRNRAQDYVNLFDTKAGFFQGRDAKGNWRVESSTSDPRVWGHDYAETNGYGYAFTAPQDSRGLANLYGGRKGLADKLDAYFSTPDGLPRVRRLLRRCHPRDDGGAGRADGHVRALQPGRAPRDLHVRRGRAALEGAEERPRGAVAPAPGSEIGQGYHGDEDNGEQSAWYLFSALGFYPLVMGSGGEYAIGSPLFTKATVHLENGRELVVKAPRNSAENVYVQGLKVNGRAWSKTSLPHSVVAKGGVLEFDMGPRPSSWGTGKHAAPVSITRGDEVPTPRADVLKGEGALFDDTSATDAAATSVDLPVPERAEAVQYTLTSSSDRAKAPTGWTLQGSSDGTTWRTLDRRSDESFAWDRQTRAFTVRSPGTYEKYRLVLDDAGTLAEVELLS